MLFHFRNLPVLKNMRYYFFSKYLICFTIAIVSLFTVITVRDLFKSKITIVTSKMRIFPLKKRSYVEVHRVNVDLHKNRTKEELKLKYILQWTSDRNVPFVYMGRGQEEFIKKSCKYYNCYVTSNPRYLGDITKFDVVAFAGPEVIYMRNEKLPQKRSPRQKYVFASIESSHYYPVCNKILDGYFNWTWTFKLDSDTRWGYIIIRNEEGNIIGPNKVMHWVKTEHMKPVSKDLMSVLKGKSKVAATFVSNCDTLGAREEFMRTLQVELDKYDLKVDVYGKCGKLKCDRSDEDLCDRIIEKHYFFYLAFENSFSEDYVTEKILHGLQYSAIPIVYGGANYTRQDYVASLVELQETVTVKHESFERKRKGMKSEIIIVGCKINTSRVRFMPDGSYLNARELGVQKLAAKMNHLVHNIEEYSTYFKWRSHYSYHKKGDTVETDDYCGICALLNDDKKFNETSVYQNLGQWWNPADYSCNFGAFKW